VTEFDLAESDLSALIRAVAADGARISLHGAGLAARVAVIRADELASLEASLAFHATLGAREAADEGIADLAAGRCQPWAELRGDYRPVTGAEIASRSELADVEPEVLSSVDLSDRARWDLDLLGAEQADECMDWLDALIDPRSYRQAWAAVAAEPVELRAELAGFRLLNLASCRLIAKLDPASWSLAVAHVMA
jgi:hypothetical protein